MIIPPSIGNHYHGSINPYDYWVDDTNIIKYFFLNSYSTKPPRSRTPKTCGYYTLQTGSYLQFLGPSAMHREDYLVGCIDRQDKMKGHTIRSHRISRSKISSNRMRKSKPPTVNPEFFTACPPPICIYINIIYIQYNYIHPFSRCPLYTSFPPRALGKAPPLRLRLMSLPRLGIGGGAATVPI